MQFPDEYVQYRARTLRDHFHTTTVREIADMAAEPEAAAGAGHKETESDALHAAADGGVQALWAFDLHVRGARPVRGRRGVVRG